ncbi:g2724 [Coccomyxa elongata]
MGFAAVEEYIELPNMAPNEDEVLGEMGNEDIQAAASEQHPDNSHDAQDDEDHLQDHQGEEGSPEQWDQGGDDFGAVDEELQGDPAPENAEYQDHGDGDKAGLTEASRGGAEEADAHANFRDVTVEAAKGTEQAQTDTAMQNGDSQKAARTSQKAKRQSEPAAPQEWELFGEIPAEMLPSPLIKVMNMPGKNVPDVTEDSLRELLEAQGLSVHSVAFDSPPGNDTKRSAFVRLTPLSPPWLAKAGPAAEGEPAKEAEGEEEKKEGGGEEDKGRSSRKRNRGSGGNNSSASIDSLAEAAVKKLSAVEPKLELAGQQLQFLAHREQVTLFIGNLTDEWQDVEQLQKDLSQHGRVERAFIAYNAQGESKNYAIVEFAVPHMALRAKRALDDVEASMRPDTSRRAEREAGGRVEQVKLLRSEFAAIKSVQSQFSRTLFVSNLPPRYKDVRDLRSIFEAFGSISDINIPVNQMTQQSRGFAFVEYKRSTYADAAYREFCANPEHPKLGKLLVSFANPAKPTNERERERDRDRGRRDQRAAGSDRGSDRGGSRRSPSRADGGDRRSSGGRPFGGGGPAGAFNRGGMGGRPGGGGGGSFGGPMGGRGGGPLGGPPGFGGPPSGPAGMRGGRGLGGPGFGMGADFPGGPPLGGLGGPEPFVQQQLQMAQQMQQIQMQRQVQAQVQRQMQAQQAALQAQLRAAQQAAQQAQQQAEQFQRAATQAQAKAAAEAEARKRAEDEARRAAARIRSPATTSTAFKRQPAVLKGGRGGNRMGAGNATGFQDTPGAAAAGGYGADASAAAGYGSQASYGADQAAGYGDASQGAGAAAYAAQAGQAGYGQSGYGAQAAYGDHSVYAAYGVEKQATAAASADYAGYQGYGQAADASGYGQATDASAYGNYSSGYGSTTSTGYGQVAAAASAAYSGYGASATGASAGYGSQGYDATASYGSAAYGQQAGYGTGQTGYGTGQQGASGGGYDAQAGYGQQPAQAAYGAVGQKRDAAGYDAAAAAQYGYGGAYGGYGTGAQSGGNAAKRSRY